MKKLDVEKTRVFDIVPGELAYVWCNPIRPFQTTSLVLCQQDSRYDSDLWSTRNVFEQEVFIGLCVAVVSIDNAVDVEHYAVDSMDLNKGVMSAVINVFCIRYNSSTNPMGDLVVAPPEGDMFERFLFGNMIIVPDHIDCASVNRLKNDDKRLMSWK